MGPVFVGAAVLAVSLILTAVLLRIPFIRRSRWLQFLFVLNPGLVGLLACATFLCSLYAPAAVTLLRFLTVALVVGSLLALVLLLPRVIYGAAARRHAPDPPGEGD